MTMIINTVGVLMIMMLVMLMGTTLAYHHSSSLSSFLSRQNHHNQLSFTSSLSLSSSSCIASSSSSSRSMSNNNHKKQNHYINNNMNRWSISKQQQTFQLHHGTLLWSTSSSSTLDGNNDSNDDNSMTQLSSLSTLPNIQNNNKTTKPLWPKVGDIVRYYDLDGGKVDGELLVGRITFIQKLWTKENNNNANNIEWIFDIIELDNIGNGYYNELNKKFYNNKKYIIRNGKDVSPISASYVRSEDAYKVPYDNKIQQPIIRAISYDLDSYTGPVIEYNNNNINNINIVEEDQIKYNAIKKRLFTTTLIIGFIGTIVAQLLKGTEIAIIYGFGVIASLLYLFLLSIKTDTMATTTDTSSNRLGNNISNLRFATPIFVLLGVTIYNQYINPNNNYDNNNNNIISIFHTVTTNQFAAAMFGFLSYRIPLFGTQIQDAIQQSSSDLSSSTGATGMAIQLIKDKVSSSTSKTSNDSKTSSTSTTITDSSLLPTILLISGPQATKRTELVKRFLEQDNDKEKEKYIIPSYIDRINDPINFERLEQRNEFIYIDPTNRYGYTKQNIMNTLSSLQSNNNKQQIMILDASVDFTKQLLKQLKTNVRIIGVWVGYNTINEFEKNINNDIDSNIIIIPDGETRDSIIRARCKEIITEIEYGISCGLFEFTIILNDNNENNENNEHNFDSSLQQLREASSYCFQ